MNAAPTVETAAKPASGVAQEFSRLNQAQKLARFLLMMEQPNAIEILKQLDEEDLEAVSSEMLKVTSISHEMQQAILEEFEPLAVEAATTLSNGLPQVQHLLDNSVGLLKSSSLISRVAPTRPPVAAMQQIVEMEPRQILNLLRQEQLQTIALVASYLSQEKAAQLLGLMRQEMREQVLERLARLAPTAIEIVENVAQALQRKAGKARARVLNQTGGVKVAAQVLNALPKDVSQSLLVSLRERNSDLADAVMNKMFTFEELERLESKTLQRILQAVDLPTFALALKTAGESLKTKLFACISRRGAENIQEEIKMMGPRRLSEIEAARAAIIEVARQLESDGEIDLEEIRQTSRY